MKTKRIITQQDVKDFFSNNINTIEDALGTVIIDKKSKEISFDDNSCLLIPFEGIYANLDYNLDSNTFIDKAFKDLVNTCLSMDLKENTELKFERKSNNKQIDFLVKPEDKNKKLLLYFVSVTKLSETEEQLRFLNEVMGVDKSMFIACTWWINRDQHVDNFYSNDSGPALLGMPLNKDKLYNTKEFQKVRENARLVSDFYDESIAMEVEAYEKVRDNERDYFGGRTPAVTAENDIIWVESYGKCLIRYPDGNPRFLVAIDIYLSDVFDRTNQVELLNNLIDTGLTSSQVGIWYYQRHFKKGRYYFTQSYQEMMADQENYNNETITPLFDQQIKQMHETKPQYEHYLHNFREIHNKIYSDELDKYHLVIPNYKDGDLHWIDVRGTVAQRNEDGEVLLFVGANVDVTESYNRNRELERLRIQNERLLLAESLAIKARNLMVWYRDSNNKDNEIGNYIYGNEMFEEKLGISRENEGLISLKELRKSFCIDDEESRKNARIVSKGLKDVLSGRTKVIKSLLAKHKNIKTGEILYLEHSVEVSELDDNQSSRIIGGVMLDVTESITYQEKINFLANYDVLTELYNRNYFEQYIANRLPDSYTVLVYDLDGLKLTNDVFGHIEGDKIIKKASDFLKEVYQNSFFISRIGGDEFVVLSKDIDNDEVVKKIAMVDSLIKEYNNINSIEMNISCGGLIVENSDLSFDKAFIEAENIMYRRKLNNRSSRKSKVLESILETLNAKTEETKDHSFRLGVLAVKTLNKLGYSRSSEVEDMLLLAKVHDIGKITVSDSILNKAGKLTNYEYEMIKKHCEAGYNIIRNITDSDRVCNGVLLHHERWDGKGYPQGLEGEDIPLFARVICLIDSYDAMTNDRIYKKAISRDEAIKEIIRCSGSQFDPRVVDAFINSLK